MSFLQHTPRTLLTMLERRFNTSFTSITVLVCCTILRRTLFAFSAMVVGDRDPVLAFVTQLIVLIVR